MSDGDGKKPGQIETQEGRPPPIEYPTIYPFKVMGRQEQDFSEYVRHLFGRLIGTEVARDSMTEQPSSKGKYVSVTVSVFLTSEEQRLRIYTALKAESRIVYYL